MTCMLHDVRRVGVALGLGVLLGAGTANAYCRTTTCDVDQAQPSCTWDSNGCAMGGQPLFWTGGCTWFGVQKGGSPRRHITYDAFHSIVAAAYSKWTHADCGGGMAPSIAAQDTDLLYGPIECANREFVDPPRRPVAVRRRHVDTCSDDALGTTLHRRDPRCGHGGQLVPDRSHHFGYEHRRGPRVHRDPRNGTLSRSLAFERCGGDHVRQLLGRGHRRSLPLPG
jgi:hypothetical protein